MIRRPTIYVAALLASVASVTLAGCSIRHVDFSSFERPPIAPELEPYGVFVGSWTWQAVMRNVDGAGQEWTGTAEWGWTLDNRSLRGRLEAASGATKYHAEGLWSWHPISKRYIWGMFNNWGYPQRGVASYDENAKCWRMDFKGVGLDGTTSYGRYRMTVIDKDTLDWSLAEWADPLRLIKKIEMNGTFKRKH